MIDKDLEAFLIFFYGENWQMINPVTLATMIQSLNNTVAWK